MHDVGLGQVGGGDLIGRFEFAEGEGEAFADAVVVDGKDVGAAKAGDEQHLDGPAADAPNLCQVLDDGFIGHAADTGESGHGAVDGFCGEVAEGEGLVVREAGSAKLLVGAVEELLGCEVLVGGEGVEAFEQPAMNGGGGLAVDLLVDDAFDEGLKWRLGAGDSHRERASAFDEFS